MELFIDGKQADVDTRTDFSVSLSVASITATESGRTGYSKNISIPMTPRNMEIMGNCEDIHGRERFNEVLHYAKIESDGFTIMEGVMSLAECSVNPMTGGCYRFSILDYSKSWVQKASEKNFSSLFPGYSLTLTGAAIMRSWIEETPVRFLPVLRAEYNLSNSSAGMEPSERVLAYEDYHPFVNVKSVVDEVFAAAGYTVASEFMDTPFFRSLHMSGNYHAKDVSVLKNRMDFMASRFSEVSASANIDGKVYADPYALLNTIGNIIDTANPNEVQDGKTLNGVFTVNGCFGKPDKRVAFTPLYEVSLGFEYKLSYITDYRIADRTELKGFNTVYLGNNDKRSFRISNNHTDRRKEFRAGKSFRCIVCSYKEGYRYELIADKITNPVADPDDLKPGDYVSVSIAEFTSPSAIVYTEEHGIYVNLRLREGLIGNDVNDFGGEWALYDGYISERGQTEIEITLISGAETVTPGSPKYFDDIYFGGAEEGMNFTLKSATVRPIFRPCPTQGAQLTFGDLGVHNINGLTVINALKHMFNLCFYTDDIEKKVYIEPRKDFYIDDVIVDWSDRIDFTKNYTLEETGTGIAKSFTFRYRNGDGAVARRNTESGGNFGSWSAEINNAYTLEDGKIYENPLFTPSVNAENSLPSALSASWVQAGDQDRLYDDFNFSPKIVSYAGMKALPDGERWGWPSFRNEYPYIWFHSGGQDGTLCFEDSEGAQGLNRYWQDTIESYRESKRLTIWLRLRPHDIEPLIFPNRLKRDFRALYALKINGETSYWRLEEICDYNPSAVSVKCVFIKNV